MTPLHARHGPRRASLIWPRVAALSLILAGTALADPVHNVTQNIFHTTIQDAVDAAVNSDELVLAPTIYSGDGNRDVDFLGKAITIRSEDPDDPAVVDATIVDCGGSSSEYHRGFLFHSGEGSDSVLAGITVTNGYVVGSAGDTGNGAPPVVDMGAYEFQGVSIPCVPPDFDCDGDVDLSDFGYFQACYTGPGVPQLDPICQRAKLDDLDDDVDLDDFGIMQSCMTGAGIPPDPDCAD
jgi:hypothetical protein